jgi:phenylacetate-CoA ligase
VYKSILSSIIYPLHDSLIKGRKTLQKTQDLNKSQYYSKEQLKTLQSEELRKLFHQCAKHNPFWKSTFSKYNVDLNALDIHAELAKLPPIDKSSIRTNFESMLSTDKSIEQWFKTTGGSTGTPLKLAYTPESFDWRSACTERGYGWSNADVGNKLLYIWGVQLGHQSRLNRFKEWLHQTLYNKVYFNCFDFSDERKKQLIKLINKQKPDAIVGYTNAVYELALYILKNNLDVHSPKAMLSAAETLHEYQREKIELAFNSKIQNTYGSREFMLIGAECEQQSGLHISVENLLVEILDDDGNPCKQGDLGQIVITDLHNYAMPFIRYKIGDLGSLKEENCSCGRNLMQFKSVEGRTLDVITFPSGKQLPGEFFPHFLKDFENIKKFQVNQDSLGKLTISIVPYELSKGHALIEQIQNDLSKHIGEDISFALVEEIALSKTGKHMVVKSEYKPN